MISGVLRYRMPIEHVIKLVNQLQLTSDSINTWKKGVEKASRDISMMGVPLIGGTTTWRKRLNAEVY